MFLSHSGPESAFRTFDGSPYGQINNPESVRSEEGTEREVVIQIIEDGHCVLEASGRSQHACLRQQSVGLPSPTTHQPRRPEPGGLRVPSSFHLQEHLDSPEC